VANKLGLSWRMLTGIAVEDRFAVAPKDAADRDHLNYLTPGLQGLSFRRQILQSFVVLLQEPCPGYDCPDIPLFER